MTLDEVRDRYGDPLQPTFEAGNIVLFDLPYPLVYGTSMVRRSRAHRLAAPIFVEAFSRIKEAGLMERARAYGGIYAHRAIRGSQRLSSHAWGVSIDLNPQDFPLGSARHQDARVTAIFKELGFSYGGDFADRKDPMHYSLVGF